MMMLPRSRGRRPRAGTAPGADGSGRPGNRVDFLDASGSNAAAVVEGGGSAAGSGEIWPIHKVCWLWCLYTRVCVLAVSIDCDTRLTNENTSASLPLKNRKCL